MAKGQGTTSSYDPALLLMPRRVLSSLWVSFPLLWSGSLSGLLLSPAMQAW